MVDEAKLHQFKIAVATGMVVWLAFATSAYAVCQPNLFPQFTVAVQANATMQNDCEPQGFQLSTLGRSLIGNADATGTAVLGRLKAIAHADYFLPQPNGQFSSSGAQVGFLTGLTSSSPAFLALGSTRLRSRSVSLGGSL